MADELEVETGQFLHLPNKLKTTDNNAIKSINFLPPDLLVAPRTDDVDGLRNLDVLPLRIR